MNLANDTAGDQLSIQVNKSLISTKVEFVKNLYLAKTWEILKKILSMFWSLFTFDFLFNFICVWFVYDLWWFA